MIAWFHYLSRNLCWYYLQFIYNLWIFIQICLVYCFASLCFLMVLISTGTFVCLQAVFIHGHLSYHRPIIINFNLFSLVIEELIYYLVLCFLNCINLHKLNMPAHRFIGYLCIHWHLVLVGRRQRNSVHVIQMKALSWTIIWGYVCVNTDKWDSLNTCSS